MPPQPHQDALARARRNYYTRCGDHPSLTDYTICQRAIYDGVITQAEFEAIAAGEGDHFHYTGD